MKATTNTSSDSEVSRTTRYFRQAPMNGSESRRNFLRIETKVLT